MKALYSMIFAILLLVIPQHARAEQVVEVDKKWTIEFSQPVDVSTLHESITIVNTQTGKGIAIKPLVVSEDGRFVTVEPDGLYRDASYEVRVSTNVKSSANESLHAPFTKAFIADETCKKYDTLKKENPVANKVVRVKNVAELGVCRSTNAGTFTMD